MRLVYLGTPELAVPPLRALVEAGHDVALVVTRVDRRRGRGGATSPSPVKLAALELGIPVSHSMDDVLTVGAELGVVVAFGRLIPPHVLDAAADGQHPLLAAASVARRRAGRARAAGW